MAGHSATVPRNEGARTVCGSGSGPRTTAATTLGSESRDGEAMSSQPQTTPDPVQNTRLRLLVTGGTGVLGRALRPLAEAEGHQLVMPKHEELDLFDPSAVADAVRGVDAVVHLATRIRSFEEISHPEAWHENDRLRAEASRILVDAAIAAGAAAYIQPTVTFVYPPDSPASEDTPVGEVLHHGDGVPVLAEPSRLQGPRELQGRPLPHGLLAEGGRRLHGCRESLDFGADPARCCGCVRQRCVHRGV